jgi:hypothetical protein
MKSLIMIWILLFAFGCVQLSFAQAPDTLWTKTFEGEYRGRGFSVQQTTDGGYIITGITSSYGAGGIDVWLVKTDASGDTLWTKTFGGDYDDWGFLVQQTTDGGYIIEGSIGVNDSGKADIWLIKTDASGDTLWTKTFGGYYAAGSLQQTTDGGYFIVAIEHLMLGISRLIKTDSKGDTVWTKSYKYGCYANSGLQTVDGGYIITGSMNPGSGNHDFLLLKTDESGDPLWTKTYGVSEWDNAWSVKQTTDGGYIIVGTMNLDSLVWLIKTDVSGDTLWTKTYGLEGLNEGYSVQQTTDGGYIIGSTTYYGSGPSHFWIIKTDASGDTLWTKTFGGSGRGQLVQQTSDGGYIIVGGTGDVWLIKLAADPVDYLSPNQNELPENYALYQNYPNPFNPVTVISWQLAVSSHVDLSIYNILGQKVATLVNKKQPVGSYQVQWDATGFATGVYYYKIEAGEYSEVKKMILIR